FLCDEVVFEGECFFFFHAEDGIRVFHVTGVQTCALPIYTLATWMAAAGPAWKMFLPMALKIGLAVSRDSGSPPIMKVSVPDAAPDRKSVAEGNCGVNAWRETVRGVHSFSTDRAENAAT